MELIKHELDQFTEFTRLWFARNGGMIDISIKQIKQEHKQEKVYIKSKDFEKA